MNSSIWLGEVNGKVLVYDPAIQLPDCLHIFLWDPNSEEMGNYAADLTRKHIKRHVEAGLTSKYTTAYHIWRNIHGSAWLAEERRYYEDRQTRDVALEKERLAREAARAEAERIENLTPAERHKERLERLGKEYLGVRPATKKPLRRRITHCYACKVPLDNSLDIECISCNWILCTCGACGCGYVGYA